MTQPLEPALDTFRNPLALYVAATRPAFLAASLVAGLLGLAAAAHSGVELHGVPAVGTLLFALLAHAGVNVLNDYYDALNGTDACNVERIFPFTGGSRFIQNGVLTAAQTARFGFALLACVALAGLWLMAVSAPQLAWVGLAGLFIGWAYSAPPFRLNGRGLGELCVAAGFLLIVVGSDFVQRGSFSMAPVYAGISYAMLVAALLYLAQFPDRTADKQAGKLHWVARLEVAQARWGYPLLVALAYVWLTLQVASGKLPVLALLGWLALPLSVLAARQLFQYADRPQQLAAAIKLTILAMLLHGGVLALVLSLSKGIA